MQSSRNHFVQQLLVLYAASTSFRRTTMTAFSPRDPKRLRRPRRLIPPLSVSQILRWADAFHAKHRCWPKAYSGPIAGTGGETWMAVQAALKGGSRGLPGGSSLARLLAEHRGHRHIHALPRLTVKQILAWADAFQARTGRWPSANFDPIPGTGGETWHTVDSALRRGARGLHPPTTLARLLAAHRGHRNRSALSPLTPHLIVRWADAHHRRTGRWPAATTSPIPEVPGENWRIIDHSLRAGVRGLPGGSSLAQLLADKRQARNPQSLPPFTIREILEWADAHHRRTDLWPFGSSGPIADAPGESWKAVDSALRIGRRGLPGGSSLARLLAQKRGARNMLDPGPLITAQIVKWAEAHHRRTGEWPSITSGLIPEAPGETWEIVNRSLRDGRRGLPGGSSLAQLLMGELGIRSRGTAPPLSVQQILAWADEHHQRTGEWPMQSSGEIPDSQGETWSTVARALAGGIRGLPQGLTLGKLLTRERGARVPRNLPPLKLGQIRTWARAYRQRSGRWPTQESGPIPEAPGETWKGVEHALRDGRRGLVGGSSLFWLLRR